MIFRSKKAIKAQYHDASTPEVADELLQSLSDRLATELRSESMVLNLLREDSEDAPLIDPSFNHRVIRKFRYSQERSSLRYWTPAIAGALVAALIFGVLLQVFQSPKVATWSNPTSEARLQVQSQQPLLTR